MKSAEFKGISDYNQTHLHLLTVSTIPKAKSAQHMYGAGLTLKVLARQLMHCDTLKQDNDSTVRGDGGSRVGEVRAGTASPRPEHKGFMLQ